MFILWQHMFTCSRERLNLKQREFLVEFSVRKWVFRITCFPFKPQTITSKFLLRSLEILNSHSSSHMCNLQTLVNELKTSELDVGFWSSIHHFEWLSKFNFTYFLASFFNKRSRQKENLKNECGSFNWHRLRSKPRNVILEFYQNFIFWKLDFPVESKALSTAWYICCEINYSIIFQTSASTFHRQTRDQNYHSL